MDVTSYISMIPNQQVIIIVHGVQTDEHVDILNDLIGKLESLVEKLTNGKICSTFSQTPNSFNMVL